MSASDMTCPSSPWAAAFSASVMVDQRRQASAKGPIVRLGRRDHHHDIFRAQTGDMPQQLGQAAIASLERCSILPRQCWLGRCLIVAPTSASRLKRPEPA